MMLRLTIPVFLLLCSLCCVHAQEDSVLRFRRLIPGEYSYFNVDNLGNIYLLNSGNQLKKISSRGDSAGVFNEVRRYGKLFYIDATNPLKLLLYYRNFSTVVVLDRFLNLRNVINLRQQNIFNVKSIATSYDGNIWVFDEGDAKLKKVDDNGTVLTETNDFRMLFDSIPSPESITDQEGYVTLYDPQKGFYVFDIYGAFKNRVPFRGWKYAEPVNQDLYGFSDERLYQYVTARLDLREYPLPPVFREAMQVKVANGQVYLLNKTGVLQFSVK